MTVWGHLLRIFGHHANFPESCYLQVRIESRHTYAVLTLTTQQLTSTEQCACFVAWGGITPDTCCTFPESTAASR